MLLLIFSCWELTFVSFRLLQAAILDKNLETLWKILLPSVFPLPFAMLSYPRNFAITSHHLNKLQGEGTCIGVSGIFGEDCSCRTCYQ